MSGCPSTWQPGDLIVNRYGDWFVPGERTHDDTGWWDEAGRRLLSDAELAAEWQRLPDVIERGWAQRQQVPVRRCLTHDDQDYEMDNGLCGHAWSAKAFVRPVPEACRLVPLFYETEGDNLQ